MQSAGTQTQFAGIQTRFVGTQVGLAGTQTQDVGTHTQVPGTQKRLTPPAVKRPFARNLVRYPVARVLASRAENTGVTRSSSPARRTSSPGPLSSNAVLRRASKLKVKTRQATSGAPSTRSPNLNVVSAMRSDVAKQSDSYYLGNAHQAHSFKFSPMCMDVCISILCLFGLMLMRSIYLLCINPEGAGDPICSPVSYSTLDVLRFVLSFVRRRYY